jgi:hypothetical protein
MVFGRRKDTPAPQESLPGTEEVEEITQRPAGKGAPTPTRRQQEAARKRPLVPNDRKAAREADRAAMQEQRILARRALETGEERYLPFRDKGISRRFIRDYVDARWNLGEFMMLAALVFVVLSFIQDLTVQAVIMMAFWVLIVAVVLDCLILRRSLRRRLSEKFGNPNPGDLWYGVSRALQLRRLRLPKPQTRRGEYPA